MQLEPELTNDLEHDGAVRIACGDKHLAHLDRIDAALSQPGNHAIRHGHTQNGVFAARRVVNDTAVLRDNQIE